MVKKLFIHYQDENYVVVEKPSGILVHPFKAESNDRITLLSLLRDQISQYVYPIHRLDRPVSGPVVFGLQSEAVSKIQKIWHSDKVEKKYQALVKGKFIEKGEFSFALKNENQVEQNARTKYSPIQSFYLADLESDFTYVDIDIFTGRKHQIRRHFSRRCSNIVCDTKYGRGKINHYFRDHFSVDRIFLHCSQLNLVNPFTNQAINVKSDLPNSLSNCLKMLEKASK